MLGGYLATLALASAYIAIGLFVSSRTDNQIVSLIVTALICGTFYVLGSDALTSPFGNDGGEVLPLIGKRLALQFHRARRDRLPGHLLLPQHPRGVPGAQSLFFGEPKMVRPGTDKKAFPVEAGGWTPRCQPGRRQSLAWSADVGAGRSHLREHLLDFERNPLLFAAASGATVVLKYKKEAAGVAYLFASSASDYLFRVGETTIQPLVKTKRETLVEAKKGQIGGVQTTGKHEEQSGSKRGLKSIG